VIHKISIEEESRDETKCQWWMFGEEASTPSSHKSSRRLTIWKSINYKTSRRKFDQLQAYRLTEIGEDNSIDFKTIRRQVDQLKVEVEGKLSQEIQVVQRKSRLPKSNFSSQFSSKSSQSKK